MKKAERESLQREQALTAEKDKLSKQLAESRASEKQLKADNDKLQAEERKLQVQLAEKDKLLGRKDVELGEAKADGKREREAREKAEKLDKENAKLIAEAADREKKEREAREKLEKERQQVAAKEKERKDREVQERTAREKLLEGPDLPANLSQKITCATLDGAVSTEYFMHCVPQDQLKAKSLVFYYRTSGNAHFDAATMSRGKKGWFTAAVPANRVIGKSLQFYVEAPRALRTRSPPERQAQLAQPGGACTRRRTRPRRLQQNDGAGGEVVPGGKTAAKAHQAAKRSKARR
jgi:hypothetical protein